MLEVIPCITENNHNKMNRESFILLLIFLIASKFSSAATKGCSDKLRELANSQMLFVSCSTNHAVPVTICKWCNGTYKNMTQKYQDLQMNCAKNYFDNDRINIISSTQSVLAGLWKKAYCDDCYVGNKTEDFSSKNTDFHNCLTRANATKDDACVSCLSFYIDLNNFYKDMDVHNNGKVCYDIQDQMNRTRSTWSKDLKCCKRDYSMFFFTLAASFIVSLPVVFYSGLFVYTKRAERNHQMLIGDQENVSSNQNLVAASSSNLSVEPSSSNRYNSLQSSEAKPGKINSDIVKAAAAVNDSDCEVLDSSDEELLIKGEEQQPSNKPLIELDC